jgi:hypothetical protein
VPGSRVSAQHDAICTVAASTHACACPCSRHATDSLTTLLYSVVQSMDSPLLVLMAAFLGARAASGRCRGGLSRMLAQTQMSGTAKDESRSETPTLLSFELKCAAVAKSGVTCSRRRRSGVRPSPAPQHGSMIVSMEFGRRHALAERSSHDTCNRGGGGQLSPRKSMPATDSVLFEAKLSGS